MLGIGSDLAGSIRMPCTFCGIFGVKPSPGLVYAGIDDGTYPPSVGEGEVRQVAYGPMCRYAQDLWLALDLLITESGRKLLKFPHPDKVFLFFSFLSFFFPLQFRSPLLPHSELIVFSNYIIYRIVLFLGGTSRCH